MSESDLDHLRGSLSADLRRKNLLDAPGLEAAFEAIPRHVFLPNCSPASVYKDEAIVLKTSPPGEVLSSSSQPSVMAVMLSQLALTRGMNVMEIGAASGYNAALMRHMVGAEGFVTTLEIDRELCEQARDNLLQSGYGDVLVVERDGISGYEPRAQYDRIVATAGVWDVPRQWLQQLRPAGRLVVPIWLDGIQVSAAFVAQPDGALLSTENRACAFVYLQGLGAGPRVRKRVGSTALEILADDVEKIDTAALHLLLSEDCEVHRLGKHLRPEAIWYGLQLFVMLHEPPDYVFAVYAIPPGLSAYGMSGNGILLFTPTSAAFAAYDEGGLVRSFAGSSAILELQRLYDCWRNTPGELLQRLRLRLIPKELGAPEDDIGKVYTRRDHHLQIWLD